MEAKATHQGEKALGTGKLDEKGRVVVPGEVRAMFKIQTGALLLFVKTRDGELVLRKL